MSDIVDRLGEVGLPGPWPTSSKTWDAVIVEGGHNGLTAAAYLAPAAPCSCSRRGSGWVAPARSSAPSRTSASSSRPVPTWWGCSTRP